MTSFQSPFNHGIPYVESTALRDALFPLPGKYGPNLRVQNAETGYYERHDGNQWTQDGLTYSAGPVVSVRAKGAKGNGTDNDRSAFKSAWTTVLANGGGVVKVTPGTYLLGDYDPDDSSSLLYLNNAGASAVNVSVIGDPGAVITTSLCSAAFTSTINFAGKLEDVLVDGLTFRSTHSTATTNATQAIGLNGGSTNANKRVTVRNCTFWDHERTIGASGVEGLSVLNNNFLYTNGRDSGGAHPSRPHVAIWCFVQDNGQTSGVRIIGNYMDGCVSGDLSSATQKTGMDGLVYGAARGWYIAGNFVKRHGFEAIYISHRQNSTADLAGGTTMTSYEAVITGNIIDGTLPTGAATADANRWGIRSDEQNTLVLGNAVKGCSQGIDVTGSGLVNALDGVQVIGNSVEMPLTANESKYGISLVTCTAPTLRNNLVFWNGTPKLSLTGISAHINGVSLFQCNRAQITGNVVRATAVPSTGKLNGIWLQQTHSALLDANRAEFCTTGVNCTQHPSNQPPNRVRSMEFLSCTAKYGGVNSSTGAVSNGELINLIAERQSVSFTPSAAATGYYRVLDLSSSGLNTGLQYFGGRFKFTANYDAAPTDVVVEADMDGGATGGAVNQVRYARKNNGVISDVRAGSDGSGATSLDVNVSKATAPSAITATLVDNEIPGLFLVDTVAFNPTGPANTAAITLNYGLVTSGRLLIGGGEFITQHKSVTGTWDPASMADGAMTSTTITVNNAAVGDTVLAAFSNALPAGVLISAAVTASNTVTVTLFNKSGSVQDLASGTLRVDLWRH